MMKTNDDGEILSTKEIIKNQEKAKARLNFCLFIAAWIVCAIVWAQIK